MPGAGLDQIIWSVAARFSFSAKEILAMPISELLYWYEGASRSSSQEEAVFKKLLGGKGRG